MLSYLYTLEINDCKSVLENHWKYTLNISKNMKSQKKGFLLKE